MKPNKQQKHMIIRLPEVTIFFRGCHDLLVMATYGNILAVVDFKWFSFLRWGCKRYQMLPEVARGNV